MSEFKIEERYIVLKLKELTNDEICDLRDYFAEQAIKTKECVVVEHDWPNYEHVWQTIQQVADGTWQSPTSERAAFELWYNNEYDVELGTGEDDVEASYEIWRAACAWQAARAQSGQGADAMPVGIVRHRTDPRGDNHDAYVDWQFGGDVENMPDGTELYTHPQPAQQGVPEGEDRLTDIYRRQLFECQDALNNLRSEYHNRMRELETEIEDLQEELQRVRRQADPEMQDKEQPK